MIKKVAYSPSIAQNNNNHAKANLNGIVYCRTAYLIAKSKKAHNIRENLIKPCFVEMADILLGNEAARKLNKISMSDNCVKKRIEDMSSDILAQIVHGIKKSAFPIVLQLDK